MTEVIFETTGDWPRQGARGHRRPWPTSATSQPHDRLFRAVFFDPGEAVSLLQTALPDTLRHSFDWATLRRSAEV